MNVISQTICWDCKKAIGGCSWSETLTPVEGWTAIQNDKDNTESYKVIMCPLFERDAYYYGLSKTPREVKLE